jgi:hypothetical protein
MLPRWLPPFATCFSSWQSSLENEPEFTRGASSTGRRGKSKFLSVSVVSVSVALQAKAHCPTSRALNANIDARQISPKRMNGALVKQALEQDPLRPSPNQPGFTRRLPIIRKFSYLIRQLRKRAGASSMCWLFVSKRATLPPRGLLAWVTSTPCGTGGTLNHRVQVRQLRYLKRGNVNRQLSPISSRWTHSQTAQGAPAS